MSEEEQELRKDISEESGIDLSTEDIVDLLDTFDRKGFKIFLKILDDRRNNDRQIAIHDTSESMDTYRIWQSTERMLEYIETTLPEQIESAREMYQSAKDASKDNQN